MWNTLLLFVIGFISARAKEPELPLCPSNMQYLPQNLPMHCRMPVTLPPFPPQMFPNPSQIKSGPFPIPLPGMPGPPPNSVPGMPMPMPMPMPMMPVPQPPAQKLPVIVMPFYSPDTSYKKNPIPPPRPSHKKHRRPIKKRRPVRYESSDEDSSSTDTSDDTSDERGWWKKPVVGRRSNRHHSKKRKQNRELLTPVLQYVTKDGYVIFEKKISKGEAKDWLVKKNTEMDKNDQPDTKIEEDRNSNEDRPDNSFNLVVKREEASEVKKDKNPLQIQKKKVLRRKPIKIMKETE